MTDSITYQDLVASVISEVVEPNALAVDRDGSFPRASIDALGRSGLLGLVSAREVGGMGEGLRAAATVVERVGSACGSTGMVLCMHYCATAVIEQHGSRAAREAIAAGRQLSTLAFSELGSRSYFWAPQSTATAVPGGVRLDAHKSWSTSAGEADCYVWSSKPLRAEGAVTLWLTPGKAAGLTVSRRFEGLGLRGNSSSPMLADGVVVEEGAMLGPDGGGFDVMMAIVMPFFQVLNAACSLGIMEAATAKAIEHVRQTRFVHRGQSLADLPTIRAYLARIRIKTDMVRALLQDTLAAVESGRPDTMLRVLEIKAAAGEAATEVTDTAMRVAGGAAFRKDVGIERHFRDARAATVMSPTTDLLYDFVGRAITGLPLFD